MFGLSKGRKSEKLNITFSAEKSILANIPAPTKANKQLPSYFKALPPQIDANPTSATVKRCVPFLEAASAGYIISLWCDVFVRAHGDDISFEFPQNLPMPSSMSAHGGGQIKGHPMEKKPFGNVPLKWHSPWVVSTTAGVSCMFTSPMNHLETRFKILDGVVDTDTYYQAVNFPFVWTGGEGDFYIQKGTPLVQVIPFVRTEFEHSIAVLDTDKNQGVANQLGTVLKDGYKTMFHHKRRDSGATSTLGM